MIGKTALTAAAIAVSGVPERMLLTKTMKATKIGTSKLTSLTFKDQTVAESDVLTVGEAVKSHTGKHGSICFVVRRPGWAFCREEGEDLKDFASKDDSPLKGFNLFGVVKETGIDDEGLAEFQSKHYPFDLYRDNDLVFYNEFLGKQKISLNTWNPYKLVVGYRAITKRLKGKSIDGNLTGEGMIKGGVILFDKNGEVKYAYQEETGSELPLDDIAAAALAIKEGTK